MNVPRVRLLVSAEFFNPTCEKSTLGFALSVSSSGPRKSCSAGPPWEGGLDNKRLSSPDGYGNQSLILKILFYFILFYFILFYFILFYFILFYFILFYFILFYFILFNIFLF